MKKFFSTIAMILASVMIFAACNTADIIPSETDTDISADTTEVSDTQKSDNEATEENQENNDNGDADEKQPTESELTAVLPNYKESVKILAIGNSFSVDAMEHLAVILKDAGVKEIVLGNLYIGGCSLWKHWSHIGTTTADYTFYVNRGNGWTNTKNQMLDTGILYEDWDVITIQQVSQDSGKTDTLGRLQEVVDHVRATATNKDVKVLWHMTWAYQNDYVSESKFGYYNNDQMTMYNAITNLVSTKIKTNNTIDGFIPSGTAIQNLRSSYLGDKLTRDGYHLSMDTGRYTAALMWFKELTGADISDITAVPSSYPIISQHLPAIKEAVNNAYANKLSVTASTHTVDPNAPEEPDSTVNLTALTDADKAYLSGLGLDPAAYMVLNLELTMNAYYNSTSSSIPVASLVTTASNSRQYIATRVFTSETLPVGSVINIADGYKYRLEGWQTLTSVNSLKRLDPSSEDMILTADHYNNYKYIAFNVSKTAGGAMTEVDASALRIYVPVN